jgi:hypothetical protein
MLMDDETAARLPLPGEAVLLDYARRAFALAARTVAAIDDEQFLPWTGRSARPTLPAPPPSAPLS